MRLIYILKKNKIISGPYTIEALQKRGVKDTDMIWFAGITDWVSVDEVDFLTDIPRLFERNKELSIIDRVFAFLK